MKEEFYSYSQMALGVEVYFTRIGDLLGGLSGWWRHLRKHLGINVSNYFMY
jgi:hypothetical protein